MAGRFNFRFSLSLSDFYRDIFHYLLIQLKDQPVMIENFLFTINLNSSTDELNYINEKINEETQILRSKDIGGDDGSFNLNFIY